MSACSKKSDRSPLHTSGLAAVFHSAKECEWSPSLTKVSIIWSVGKVNLSPGWVFYCLSCDSDWNKLVRHVSCLFELQMKKWHLFSPAHRLVKGSVFILQVAKKRYYLIILHTRRLLGGRIVPLDFFHLCVLKTHFYHVSCSAQLCCLCAIRCCCLTSLTVTLSIQVQFERYLLNLRDQNPVGRAFLHCWEKCPSVTLALKSKQTLW